MRCLLFLILISLSSTTLGDDLLQSSLERAKENRAELELALKKSPASQLEGMEFLIRHMPNRDLTTLKSEFLLKNVKYF